MGEVSSGTAQSEAIAYCDRLTELERAAGEMSAEWKYSLPTSAQWEYACRAGTTTSFGFDGPVTLINDFAWQLGNTEDDQRNALYYRDAIDQPRATPLGVLGC